MEIVVVYGIIITGTVPCKALQRGDEEVVRWRIPHRIIDLLVKYLR